MANRILAHRVLHQDSEVDSTQPNDTGMGGVECQEASSPPHHTIVSMFSKVLTSFKTHLSQKDMDHFKIVTFNDLKSVVKDIQTEQARRKSLRNMAKIRPYLDGLAQYAAVIEVFVNSRPDILAFIWGPIKFCLKIASNFSEAFDALLDAYNQIGDALPIFSDINDLFSSHSSVQQVLVNVYEDILDFHGRAVKFFKQRAMNAAWKITIKLAFGTFPSMFKDVLENLGRSKDLLYRSADMASFREAQDSRTLFKQRFHAQEREEMNDRRSTALEWLSHESCDRFHEELQEIRRKYPETARWIFHERALKEWLSGIRASDHPFWISGIPGAGKTVLFSSIVDEIRNTSPRTTVIYFYCKYNNVQRNSYQEIVKSLIAQLLYNNNDCLRYLCDKAIASSERHPSTNNLLKELLGTMAQLHHDIVIGIDGIDECEPLERQLILSLVRDLLKLSDTDLNLKIFVASCAEKDLEESMRLSTRLVLKSDHMDEDINSYINIRSIALGQNFSFSEKRVHEIAAKVADRPKGMFLLARLIMDNLHSQETWDDIDEELRTEILPRRIDEAYGRILLRIRKHENSKHQARVKQILGMITVAKRSLWLHEIHGALSIRLDDKSIDFENRQLRKHLKELCGPIVEIHEDNSIELVHHTAKTFLEQSPSEHFINHNIANLNMLHLCMSYLTFDCVVSEFNCHEYLERVKRGEYAFLEYSTCYWVQHLRSVRSTEDEASKETKRLTRSFRELLDLHYEALLSSCTSKDNRNITPTNPNATWELLDYIQESFEAAHTIASDGEQSGIPKPKLYHLLLRIRDLVEDASEERNGLSMSITEAYGMLIFKCPIVRCKHFHWGFRSRGQRDRHVKGHERSFKCTFEGCDYKFLGFAWKDSLTAHNASYHDPLSEEPMFPKTQPRSTWKALEDAIDKDDEIAVRALCEEAARLPNKKFGFLLRAVEKESTKAAYILVELLGVDSKEMNHKGRGGRRALHVAAGNGGEDLVRRMSESSADVNIRDKKNMSPICIAALNGHLGVVQFLLHHDRLDLNLHRLPKFVYTPLKAAAAMGHLHIVQVLLEDGTQQYVEKGHFAKALSAAGSSGHESVVRFLLEKGAAVNAQSTYGKRLAAAFVEGIDVATEMLLQTRSKNRKRGEVDEAGKTYSEALQAAVLKGDEASTMDLLEQGADINEVSGYHGTALQGAANRGQNKIIRMLLDNGAAVSAAGGYYGSALQAAAYKGQNKTVQMLLENGATVNAAGGHFGSALQAAAYKGQNKTVQMLLDNGAAVNAAGGLYGSALHAAAWQGQNDTIQMLLDNGAAVNAAGGHFGSALQAAAHQGQNETVQMLLDNGAAVNAAGGLYGSALQAAACQGQNETVQMLLNNGAAVNAAGGENGSVLQAAAWQGQNETVQILLDNGAAVNAAGGHRGSALQAAAWQGQNETVQMLLNNGAAVNAAGGHRGSALHAAAWQGQNDTVQMLLDNGAAVNAAGGHFGSALQAAAHLGQNETVQMLLDNGAAVNAAGGYYGSALQAAAYKGQNKTIQMLLDNGAAVNAAGGLYGNALHAAAYQGQNKTVQMLLDNGAAVNAAGGYYGNALQAAAYLGFQFTVELLLNNGADVNAAGGAHGNALQAAKNSNSSNKEAVMELLEAAVRKSRKEVPISPSAFLLNTPRTPLRPDQNWSPDP